jgi:hypothetical protein
VAGSAKHSSCIMRLEGAGLLEGQAPRQTQAALEQQEGPTRLFAQAGRDVQRPYLDLTREGTTPLTWAPRSANSWPRKYCAPIIISAAR